MKWATRTPPSVDSLACAWLICRAVDPAAELLFAPADEVLALAARETATPFAVPGAHLARAGETCAFDALVERHGSGDVALFRLATIIRGAETPFKDLAPEASGLDAVLDGIRRVHRDGPAQLAAATVIFDALYHHCLAKETGDL